MMDRYNHQVERLLDGVLSLCYFMRGGITYDEMLNTTVGERARIEKFVSKRLEAESKKIHPVY